MNHYLFLEKKCLKIHRLAIFKNNSSGNFSYLTMTWCLYLFENRTMFVKCPRFLGHWYSCAYSIGITFPQVPLLLVLNHHFVKEMSTAFFKLLYYVGLYSWCHKITKRAMWYCHLEYYILKLLRQRFTLMQNNGLHIIHTLTSKE